MVKVKICGITNLEDAQTAIRFGADELGFNFYSGSKRFVSLETAKSIVDDCNESARRIGVFVNEQINTILEYVDVVGLDTIQLHGDETHQFVSDLLKRSDREIIKAVRIASAEELTVAMDYDAHYVLLDSASQIGYGGTGQVFDWSIAENATVMFPYLYLAGGLTSENVAEAIRVVRPYAVDVASGVESSPGKKDPKKLEVFIRNAKNA